MSNIVSIGARVPNPPSFTMARASTADICDTIANMLTTVKGFAENALKDQVNGGHFQDEANGVLDAIANAIGEARKVESDLGAP